MGISVRLLYQAFQAYRHSENLGDIAILKSEGAGAVIDPAIAPLMESVVGYHPKIDLDELIKLPSTANPQVDTTSPEAAPKSFQKPPSRL